MTSAGNSVLFENMTPKILVVGHSWAKEFFTQHKEIKILCNVEVEYIHKDGATLNEIIPMASKIVRPYHTHLLLFSIMTDAYQKGIPGRFDGRLMVPNESFKAEEYGGKLLVFVEECQKVNPNITVVLLIPPVLDLVYYNQLHVPFYREQLREFYGIIGDVEPLLHRKACKVFDEIERIRKSPNIRWPRKICYTLSKLVLLVKTLKPRYQLFLRQQIYTLGDNECLCDGIHPTPEFIRIIWQKLLTCNFLMTSWPAHHIPVGRPLPEGNRTEILISGAGSGARSEMQGENDLVTDNYQRQNKQKNQIATLNNQDEVIEDLFSSCSAQRMVSIEAMVNCFQLECKKDPRPSITVQFIESHLDHTVAFMLGYAEGIGEKVSEKSIRKILLQYLNSSLGIT